MTPRRPQGDDRGRKAMKSVVSMSSAEAVDGLLSLVNAAEPVLDATYGSGDF
jgi:hypothetical protein